MFSNGYGSSKCGNDTPGFEVTYVTFLLRAREFFCSLSTTKYSVEIQRNESTRHSRVPNVTRNFSIASLRLKIF